MAIVHSAEAIQALLVRGLTPITDNPDALLQLGFERAYPQVERGYDSTIWERAVELPNSALSGRRQLGRERAYLERRAV